MKCEINLFSQYYPWNEIKLNGVKYYLKGKLFLNDKLLSLEKLAESICPLICREDESQEKELGEFLEGLNGEFAIVAENEIRIFCAVDKLRSIPLFYAVEGGNFVSSSS